MEKEKRVRINIEVHNRVKERIDRIIYKTEIETITDVIKDALYLYEQFLDAENEGKEIVIRDKDGKEKVVFFKKHFV